MSPSKDTLYNLPQGANVYSSTDAFAKENGLMDDLLRSSILTSVNNDINRMNNRDLEANFNKSFDRLGKQMIGSVKDGLKGVKYKVINNISVDASHSDYTNSLQS